jgi:hypothetical protein
MLVYANTYQYRPIPQILNTKKYRNSISVLVVIGNETGFAQRYYNGHRFGTMTAALIFYLEHSTCTKNRELGYK